MHTLMQLFPEGAISESPYEESTHISILIAASEWFCIPTTNLSDREIFLIETLQKNSIQTQSILHLNPWQDYLSGHRQSPPNTYSQLQLIYIHTQVIDQSSFLEKDWTETLLAVLPNCYGHFCISEDLYVFIIDAQKSSYITNEIEHYLLPIEDDFAVHMTVFLGNYWSDTSFDSRIFFDEIKMFKQYLSSSNRHKFISFNKLLFWYLLNGYICEDITTSLVDLLQQQEQITSIIEELWQQKGVLTKTAQNLFLHRNTLQYRIDKFSETTGLSLKNMDDLALCYLILHRNSF